MKILAWFYLAVIIIELLAMPAQFGKTRKPIDFNYWLTAVVINLPLLFLLVYLILNKI